MFFYLGAIQEVVKGEKRLERRTPPLPEQARADVHFSIFPLTI
jgi:hypothetical protein